MMWADISLETRTELHIGENFLYLQDNATLYTAGIVNDLYQLVGINLLPLPARSLDLNLIQQVWDMRIRTWNNAPITTA